MKKLYNQPEFIKIDIQTKDIMNGSTDGYKLVSGGTGDGDADFLTFPGVSF